MPRELSQFETYLVHEFVEDYVDGLMSRRDMMRRVLHITGGRGGHRDGPDPARGEIRLRAGGHTRPTTDPDRAAQHGQRGRGRPEHHGLGHHLPGRRRRGDHRLPGDACLRRRTVPGRPHLS